MRRFESSSPSHRRIGRAAAAAIVLERTLICRMVATMFSIAAAESRLALCISAICWRISSVALPVLVGWAIDPTDCTPVHIKNVRLHSAFLTNLDAYINQLYS